MILVPSTEEETLKKSYNSKANAILQNNFLAFYSDMKTFERERDEKGERKRSPTEYSVMGYEINQKILRP